MAEIRGQALRWKTANADEVTINGDLVELTGIMKIDPSASKIYVLVAKNRDGKTASEMMQVGSHHPNVELRTTPQLLTGEQVRELYQSKGLHDSKWNPDGDLNNSFEFLKLNGDAVVIDHATGLMWHQSGSISEMANWDDARDYLKRLNEQQYAGFSDWRLSTLEELATIIEPTKRNGELHVDPVFDAKQTWLWSADKAGERYGYQAWGIGLEYAHANIHSLKIVRFGSVWPVRPHR